MGIRGGSVLVPWRPAFWIAAEVVNILISSAGFCASFRPGSSQEEQALTPEGLLGSGLSP